MSASPGRHYQLNKSIKRSQTGGGGDAPTRSATPPPVGAAPGLSKAHNRTEESIPSQLKGPSITWFPGASLVDVHVPREHPKRDEENSAPRGKIEKWSKSSRARLKRLLGTLKREELKRARVVTLTYPKEFPAPNDHEVYKYHLKKFLTYLLRKWDVCSGIWKLEFQPNRGAAHYHLMLYGLDHVSLEELRKWIRETWYLIAHKGDKNLGVAGTQVDGIKSVGGAVSYLVKYLSKDDQTMPGNFSGRYWGKINKYCLPVVESKCIVIADQEAQQYKRIARKKMQKDVESSRWKRFLKEEENNAKEQGFDKATVGNRLFWEHLKSVWHGRRPSEVKTRLATWNYKHVQVLGEDNEFRNPYGFYVEVFDSRLVYLKKRALPKRWKAKNNDRVRVMCNADSFMTSLSRLNNPASSFLEWSRQERINK